MFIILPAASRKCSFYKKKMTILTQLTKISSNLLRNDVKGSKSLWGYVAIAFNRVDTDRLMQVGPDRLCAEWLIKNGGAIRTTDAPNRLVTNYNTLPSETYKFKIQTADASGSSIMKIGLEHFRGCEHINTVILHQCKHLESDGLLGLTHLCNSLKVLQVSDCGNITDDGLLVIGKLDKLMHLKIFDMRYVKDITSVKKKLSEMIPKCQMDIK